MGARRERLLQRSDSAVRAERRFRGETNEREISVRENVFRLQTKQCQSILSQLLDELEKLPLVPTELTNPTRKRRRTSSSTPAKKICSEAVQSSTMSVDENANDLTRSDVKTVDYLSLEPERIVSITRSRLPSQELEFLLKCTRCPSKLFFISNDQAKELVPELLIEFYERHINWFIDSPSTKSRGGRWRSKC